jgi:hypothetical protein
MHKITTGFNMTTLGESVTNMSHEQLHVDSTLIRKHQTVSLVFALIAFVLALTLYFQGKGCWIFPILFFRFLDLEKVIRHNFHRLAKTYTLEADAMNVECVKQVFTRFKEILISLNFLEKIKSVPHYFFRSTSFNNIIPVVAYR